MTDEARTPLQVALTHVLADVDRALAVAGKTLLDEGAPPSVVLDAIVAVRAKHLPCALARAERLAGRIERAVTFNEIAHHGDTLQ